jgi:hypothetical protein
VRGTRCGPAVLKLYQLLCQLNANVNPSHRALACTSASMATTAYLTWLRIVDLHEAHVHQSPWRLYPLVCRCSCPLCSLQCDDWCRVPVTPLRIRCCVFMKRPDGNCCCA